MQNPEQSPKQAPRTESHERTINRSVEMNSAEQTTRVAKAPLYSSPWLAFFYIIRQGWGQTRP